MPSRFVFSDVPVNTTPEGRPFSDAEIIARGVDQGGPSFEVRVFLNNKDADDSTPPDEQHGYAGSFHVYGFGLDKPGDSGSHKLPTDYSVPATRAIRAASQRSPSVTVTLVPRYYNVPATASRALRLEGVSIATR
jgi:hypothetical protein